MFPDKQMRPPDAKWLFTESKKHHIRTAANTVIAHYKDEKRRLPSDQEVRKLIERGGWETEEELMAWVGPIITRFIAVRDAILAYHKLEGLTE